MDAGFDGLASVTYLLSAVQLKVSSRSKHDGRGCVRAWRQSPPARLR